MIFRFFDAMCACKRILCTLTFGGSFQTKCFLQSQSGILLSIHKSCSVPPVLLLCYLQNVEVCSRKKLSVTVLRTSRMLFNTI